MTRPAPLCVFALRQGLLTLDDVLAEIRTAGSPEGVGLAWGLAPGLDDAQLAGLHAALRDAGLPVAPAQHEQLRRGQLAAARGDGAAVTPDVLELALAQATGAERGAWIAVARDRLDAAFADESADTRARLAIAKLALRFAPEDLRTAHAAALRAGFEADEAADAYAEIDLAYGDVDPSLELARTCASVGDHATAAALLDAREARHAAFFNIAELADAIDMAACAQPDARTAYLARFARWVGATEDSPEEAGVYAVRWWTSPAPPAELAASELGALVAGPLTAAALLELLAADRAPADVRAAAIAGLVEAAAAHVATLVEVTRGGPVSDWARQATALRGLRTAAHALTRDGVVLDDAARDRLRATAQTWSDWVITRDVSGDSLPYVYTGIALATLAADAVGPASAHLTRLVHAGGPVVLGYEDWDRLYPPAEALAVARAALSR